MVKFVHQRHALDLHESARLHIPSQLRHLIVVQKHLDRHRIGEVRHIEDQDRPLVLDLPLVHIEDLAADDHLAHLADDIVDRHGLLVKIPAVQHVRIVGTFQRPPEIALLSVFALSAALERRLCTITACLSLSRQKLSRPGLRL